MQQVQTVAAGDLIVAVDLNRREEGVDGRAQARDGRHGGGEVFRGDGGLDRGLGGVEGQFCRSTSDRKILDLAEELEAEAAAAERSGAWRAERITMGRETLLEGADLRREIAAA